MKNRFLFHALVEPAEEGGYIAICLDLDIVTEGRTEKEALKNLKEAVEMYVESVFEEGDYSSLFRPAPKEYWDRAFRSKPRIDLISA